MEIIRKDLVRDKVESMKIYGSDISLVKLANYVQNTFDRFYEIKTRYYQDLKFDMTQKMKESYHKEFKVLLDYDFVKIDRVSFVLSKEANEKCLEIKKEAIGIMNKINANSEKKIVDNNEKDNLDENEDFSFLS